VRPESLEPPLEAPLGETVAPPPPPDDPDDEDDDEDPDDEDPDDEDPDDEEEPESDDVDPDRDAVAVLAVCVFVPGSVSRGTMRV
jgi:hypothetical protein